MMCGTTAVRRYFRRSCRVAAIAALVLWLLATYTILPGLMVAQDKPRLNSEFNGLWLPCAWTVNVVGLTGRLVHHSREPDSAVP